MDFFRRQEEAQRRSRLLVVLFLVALVLNVCLLYGALALFTDWNEGWLDWRLLGWVAVGTTLVVVTGSLLRMRQLAYGGVIIAQGLGGRELDPDTRDAEERMLLNVVEEMAIAAGLPVPTVCLLDRESGMNAFTAGNTVDDAVIGVTKGCLEKLTRDELQGIMAHQFSHILRGDMSLNLRIVGVLHGLSFIGRAGYAILRGTSRIGSGGGGLLLWGLLLMGIGAIGTTLARLIKFAILRERTILADAAAVEFTRNPEGLISALKKIGGYTRSTRLVNITDCEMMSHMMFGEASYVDSRFFSSHPPLFQRVLALEPSWNRQWSKPDQLKHFLKLQKNPLPLPPAVVDLSFLEKKVLAEAPTQKQGLDQIGQPGPASLEAARRLEAELAPEIHALLRDQQGAQMCVFGLMMARHGAVDEESQRKLAALLGPQAYAASWEVAAATRAWGSAQSIAFIDLAMPALRRLSPDEVQFFKNTMEELAQLDGREDLFEFMVSKVVRRHLDGAHSREMRRQKPDKQVRGGDLFRTVLDAFISVSGVPGSPAREQAEATASGIMQDHGFTWHHREVKLSLYELDRALDHFNEAQPAAKKRLLEACNQVLCADREATNEEEELMRAVADSIGCPVPLPLI